MKHVKLSLVIFMTFLVAACGGSDSNLIGAKSTMAAKEPVRTDTPTTQTASYTCAMHPHYISTDADGVCPVCGMDLVPIKSDVMPLGDVPVLQVPAGMLQTMGVRTSLAEVVAFKQTLRAFGTVEANERLAYLSVSRIEGWVERLKVNAEGDAVSQGDLLYSVYSPDLVSAQRDYLAALRSKHKARIQSMRQRLTSLGLQEAVLTQLTSTMTALERVPVYAESNGRVTELHVSEGSYVTPGTLMLRIQSYQTVWVMAHLSETDLPLIRNGIAVGLRFPSAPKAPNSGHVDTVYPAIDLKSRTAKVRIEVDNAVGHLLEGAYADVTFRFKGKPRLSIVSEALLRDSRGSHVIVSLGGGRFISRPVSTGISANGRTEIVGGLNQGEWVVASGQFMLDSEVSLREGLMKLSPITGGPNDE